MFTFVGGVCGAQVISAVEDAFSVRVVVLLLLFHVPVVKVGFPRFVQMLAVAVLFAWKSSVSSVKNLVQVTCVVV